jgi:hypothetical protein
LIPFNSFEEALEISSAESTEVVSLDDLDENRGSIHQGLE